MTDPAATWYPARNLRPWLDNYLDHPPEQLEVIKASIRRNGWGSPCVAQAGTSRLIAGHGRLAAFLQLLDAGDDLEALGEIDAEEQDRLLDGLVPVRFRGVSDERANELALADNESVRLAIRDEDRLAAVVRSLAEDTEIRDLALGLPEIDVQALLEGSGGASVKAAREVAAPPVPPLPEEPDSEPGAVYELGPHRLICGDTHADGTLEALLGEQRVTVVFTDPPYAIYGSSTGVGESITDDRIVRPFFGSTLRKAASAVPTFGAVYVCCDWRSWASWWDQARGTPLQPKNLLVWDKGGSGLGNNYANTHELIGYFISMPPAVAMKSGRAAGIWPVHKPNILRFDRVQGKERQHNAAKPTGLIEAILDNHKDHGDRTVLDLFGGSGSTLIAAARAGWSASLIEIEPGWCDVIRRRWHAWATDAGVDPGPGALEHR